MYSQYDHFHVTACHSTLGSSRTFWGFFLALWCWICKKEFTFKSWLPSIIKLPTELPSTNHNNWRDSQTYLYASRCSAPRMRHYVSNHCKWGDFPCTSIVYILCKMHCFTCVVFKWLITRIHIQFHIDKSQLALIGDSSLKMKDLSNKCDICCTHIHP